MKIKNYTLLFFVGLVLFLGLGLMWLYPNPGYIVQTTLFLLIITFPGLLLVLFFRLADYSLYKLIPLIVSLSLSIIMIGGLFINQVLPYFSLSQPLGIVPAKSFLSITLLALFALVSIKNRRNKEISVTFTFSASKFGMYFVLTCMPLLSIAGALHQNNGGSNSLTMVLLLLCSLSSLLIMLFFKQDQNIVSLGLYSIALSLLLMLSMRSIHISGSDIFDEYKVFNVSRFFLHWDMDNIRHAYNACLSITVLPTILHSAIGIQPEFVYKLFYQIAFAVVPVGVYSLFTRISTPAISFISTLFLMSQPAFIQPMTSLARQEIAFIFFVSILILIFQKPIKGHNNFIALLLTGFGLVVSHYSTTYITLLLLAGVLSLNAIYNILISIPLFAKLITFIKFSGPNKTHLINPLFVLILITFTIFWYSFFTKSADNLTESVNSSFSNLTSIFQKEVNTHEASQALSIFNTDDVSEKDLIQRYETEMLLKYSYTENPRYPQEETSKFPIHIRYNVATQGFFTTTYTQLTHQSFQILRTFLKGLLPLGVLYLIFRLYLGKKIDREYTILSIIGAGFIVAMLIFPAFSGMYNLSRVYIQTMMFMSILIVFGGNIFFFFLPNHLRTKIIGTIIIIVMLYQHGFVSQIVGGGFPYMQLNSYGEDYDKFYTHTSEVVSASWLNNNKEKGTPLFADKFSYTRLKAFGNPDQILTTVLPKIIFQNSYVYSRYTNVVKGTTQDNFLGTNVVYEYPNKFLHERKSLIYSNGSSEIFK